jgi:hypothetical protein
MPLLAKPLNPTGAHRTTVGLPLSRRCPQAEAVGVSNAWCRRELTQHTWRSGSVHRVTGHARFIKQLTSSTTYHPDGTVETTKDPAVWTLAHRGYSGCGRLDVWAYSSKKAAIYEGAKLAMACGMDEDEQACALFTAGRYEKVMERYEETHPETHLLRAQAAFLQFAD